jgi:hypothetical protein
MCSSLSSILFESDSVLKLIHQGAFSNSSLQSIIIPRNVEILGSSCFSKCTSLSSIQFESDSQLKRIEAQACDVQSVCYVAIPAAVCFIPGDAFLAECELFVSDCDSCIQLKSWCADRAKCGDNAVDFRVSESD